MTVKLDGMEGVTSTVDTTFKNVVGVTSKLVIKVGVGNNIALDEVLMMKSAVDDGLINIIVVLLMVSSVDSKLLREGVVDNVRLIELEDNMRVGINVELVISTTLMLVADGIISMLDIIVVVVMIDELVVNTKLGALVNSIILSLVILGTISTLDVAMTAGLDTKVLRTISTVLNAELGSNVSVTMSALLLLGSITTEVNAGLDCRIEVVVKSTCEVNVKEVIAVKSVTSTTILLFMVGVISMLDVKLGLDNKVMVRFIAGVDTRPGDVSLVMSKMTLLDVMGIISMLDDVRIATGLDIKVVIVRIISALLEVNTTLGDDTSLVMSIMTLLVAVGKISTLDIDVTTRLDCRVDVAVAATLEVSKENIDVVSVILIILPVVMVGDISMLDVKSTNLGVVNTKLGDDISLVISIITLLLVVGTISMVDSDVPTGLENRLVVVGLNSVVSDTNTKEDIDVILVILITLSLVIVGAT